MDADNKGIPICFSAGASNTAGVLLTFVGTETLRKVHQPTQIVFASIPLFFAAQQFTEGVLWLSMPHPEYAGVRNIATYLFLIMAQIIWPLMVPMSVLIMEKHKTRKRILLALLSIGILTASYFAYTLIFYHPFAEIRYLHIAYQSTFRNPIIKISVAAYLMATIIPLFISSIKRTHILGIIAGISFLVSVIFYTQCLISVWCFFAAVI